MKRLILLIVWLLVMHPAPAQKSIEATTVIKSATIYLQGAEMLMRSSVNVPAGSSDIVFTNLPQYLNASTIQVSASSDLTILSAVFALNYLHSMKESTIEKRLKDSLDLLTSQLKKTIGQKNIVKGQMDLLNANKDVSGQNTGLNMDQLARMYEFYAVKMNDLISQQLTLELKEKILNEIIQKVQNQTNEFNSKYNQPTGEITVSVASKAAQSSTFNISFLISDAGWSPVYDVRSKDVKSPVTLNYKANVWQRSGIDWNDIKVKLSTGNPTVDATGPSLAIWFLDFYHPIIYGVRDQAAPSQADGYIKKSEAMENRNMDSNSSTAADYTTVTRTQLTAEFIITIPYDIPSDGKPHLIAIQDYQLPATYRYYAVPKLDNDAFLVADISAWEDLSLLPGTANIFFEGTYVGQSYLDPASTSDSLTISLGRDKSIVIRREKVKDYSKPKAIGDNVRQSFAYNIIIKNTKSEAIDIKILDQFPISQQGKIEVTPDDAGGASTDQSTGKLTWNLHLEKNEEKKVQFSFTVKYPKDQVISGL
ncbi:MAG: DUF4139 domain-containing protein [Chitinophagales bacterium]